MEEQPTDKITPATINGNDGYLYGDYFVTLKRGYNEFMDGSLHSFDGSVYPVSKWSRFGSDETGYYFTDKNSSCGESTDDIRSAEVKMAFTFCTRGVWEGRIYMVDDEYWDHELSDLSDLYKAFNEYMKNEFKKHNPKMNYDNY